MDDELDVQEYDARMLWFNSHRGTLSITPSKAGYNMSITVMAGGRVYTAYIVYAAVLATPNVLNYALYSLQQRIMYADFSSL